MKSAGVCASILRLETGHRPHKLDYDGKGQAGARLDCLPADPPLDAARFDGLLGAQGPGFSESGTRLCGPGFARAELKNTMRDGWLG
jgi:hypothetical protein